MNVGLQYCVEQFFYCYVEFCDVQDWDGYFVQFDEQCEFYLLQWEFEQCYICDLKCEMLLIYYFSCVGLEDWVFCICIGKVVFIVLMLCILYQIGNVCIVEEGEGLL